MTTGMPEPPEYVRTAIGGMLAATLVSIRDTDPSRPGAPAGLGYGRRNVFIYRALADAAIMGLPCGIRFDKNEGEAWPVVYIDLPDVGQVSWHVPEYEREWDGHDTDEKYRRIQAYVEAQVGHG